MSGLRLDLTSIQLGQIIVGSSYLRIICLLLVVASQTGDGVATLGKWPDEAAIDRFNSRWRGASRSGKIETGVRGTFSRVNCTLSLSNSGLK